MRNATVAICAAAVIGWLSSAGGQGDQPTGIWEVLPRKLVSGDTCDIRIRYRNGDQPLPPGSSFSMEVQPISVTQLQAGTTSEGLVPDPDATGEPKATVAVAGVTEEGALKARVTFADEVPAGGVVTLRYGNRQLDGRMAAIVNPVPVNDLAWDVRYHASADDKDGMSWSERGWWRALPRVDIRPAEAAAVRITAPTMVAIGKPFSVRIAVTDRFDSRADPPFVGSVRLSAPSGMSGIPETVRFAPADASCRVIPGVRVARAGIYRIGARLAASPADASRMPDESNPIVARADVSRPIYWGVLHGRAGYTGGWGEGADSYFRYAREVAGLDFAALTENLPSTAERAAWRAPGLHPARYGKQLTADDVERAVLGAAGKHDRAGEFVAIAGYLSETSSASAHAVYTSDAPQSGFARIIPPSRLDFPFELYAALSKSEPLIIHHANAAYLPYSSLSVTSGRSGASPAPVLECYSDRGMAFPGPGPYDPLFGGVRSPVAKSLFRVIGRGLRLGLVGDSGTVTGWPGRRFAAGIAPRHRFMPGLTAVRASSLSRKGVLDAYRKRDVYATTGERIALSFTIGGTGMGGTALIDGPAVATVEASGTGPIAAVSLFNGDRVLTQARFANRRDVRTQFDLPAPQAEVTPYMVEVLQVDGHRAWSSPIWVRRRAAPDLAWALGADGKLYVRNAGSAAVAKVVLQGHRTDYGFVRPAWKPEYPLPAGADGQVWLRRWSDRRATLFVSWRGAPLAGSVSVTGQTAYEPEPDYALLSNGGSFRHNGAGTMEFTDTITGGRGLGVYVTLTPQRLCVARLTFTREVGLRMDGRIERGREFTVPLNRLTGASGAKTVTVTGLAPGGRYAVPESGLCWMADPSDAIAESDEGNNLWVPSGAR
ncbi:MAG: DUF3604 domain-containing protein [Chthonomonadales bacterium]|nr:DUF3604 domain-containing protein [Chthonomonadales bacterium]